MKTRVAMLDLAGHPTAVLPVKAEVADDIERAKATIVKYKQHFPKHTLVFRQPSTRVYGDTTAVDNGYFHAMLVDAKGQATTLLGRYSITYVKQGGKWVIVTLHGSRLPVSP